MYFINFPDIISVLLSTDKQPQQEVTEIEGACHAGPCLDHRQRQFGDPQHCARARVYPRHTTQDVPLHGLHCRGEELVVPGDPEQDVCTEEAL